MTRAGFFGFGMNHASNALYNNRSLYRSGEALTFREAVELIQGECDHEIGATPAPDPEFWTQEDYDKSIRGLEGLKQGALVALSIYERLGDEAQAAEEMQQSEDENVRNIGYALANDDYSELAI